MTTFTVWVLVFFMDGYKAGGPAVIDGLASQTECERVRKVLQQNSDVVRARCIEVVKKGQL